MTHQEAGATEADGGGFFKGEADRLGGGTEAACSLGECGLPAAAEIKLGASLEVRICHFLLLIRNLARISF